MTIEKFENKLFSYKILRDLAWEKTRGDKNISGISKLSKNEIIKLEQTIYDTMGEDGWFPAGFTQFPYQSFSELFLIFSRLKQ